MRTLLTTLIFLAITGAIRAADTGDDVVVIYNSRVPESKDVADHYAALRNVPASQVLGFAMTTNESMTRAEFTNSLQRPLAEAFESKKLWHIGPSTVPATNGHPERVISKVLWSKFRYAVLCYGVPLRIYGDSNLIEPIEEKMKPELRRNGAAVDSELALLPCIEQNLPLAGLVGNSFYTTTNASRLQPTNGILMVARLDGPTASIARGLVDKALEAESNGLCGRAYFDCRNLPTNSPYAMGDEWILSAAKICQYFAGFETTIDDNPGTFPADFPMSQIAIYCGWYDDRVSGPFAQKTVEFMPGAFAYHLHSFSAATLRSTTESWVGPLLAKGATVSMGCVDEPYLSGTPDVSVFCARWIIMGVSFGEAAYISQRALSWQTTVVGDPLYRPFGKPLRDYIEEQQANQSKLIEWSYLRLANARLAQGKGLFDASTFLQSLPATKESAVLTEKLADLYSLEGKPSSTIETYQTALTLAPSPMQRVRIRLELADKFDALGQTKEQYTDLKALIDEAPGYPGRPVVFKKAADLASKLGDKAAAAELLRDPNP